MRNDTIQKELTYFFAPADLEEEIYGCKRFRANKALGLVTLSSSSKALAEALVIVYWSFTHTANQS